MREAKSNLKPNTASQSKATSVPLPPPVAKKRDSLRIVPLTSVPTKSEENPTDLFESPEKVFQQLASLPPGQIDESPLILTDVEDDEQQPRPLVSRQQGIETLREAAEHKSPQNHRTGSNMPPDLAEALAELAGPSSSRSVADSTNGKTHVSIQYPPLATPGKPWFFVRILIFTSTLAGAFAAGLFADKLRSFDVPKPSNLNRVAEKNSEDAEQVVLKQSIPAPPAENQTIETISGRITYMDNAGAEKPDANALAMLLPTVNASSLKLDSAPLRDLQQTPGRMAVESALSVLGAAVVRADDDGQFKLPRRVNDPVVLIVVSRHASRPESETTPDEVSAAMASWLTSPSQLIGRLAAQTHPLSAVAKDTLVPPFKITFHSSK